MIIDMLKQHNEREKASFHMPGHKKGSGFSDAPFSGEIFTFDTTEVPGTDALIAPEDAILRAEEHAASLYGAKHSFFLVNGSTGGILSMIYSAFRPGDKVIIDRNCHQSVLNGSVFSGLSPIYLTPESTALSDVPGTVKTEKIKALLEENPDIRGAIITSPNYYGATANIREIADLLHKHNALLLVDEAHGAHFPFSNRLPESAVSLGADMSVVSLHKTLPAPNQTALLNIGKNISIEKTRNAIRMFQTSSPSYVLLVAMEYALHYAEEKGEAETERILSLLHSLNCPTLDDPFKLMPTWAEKGISGYMAEEIMRKQFGIYVELCNTQRILCMTSWCNTEGDIRLLSEAIAYLDALPQQGRPITYQASTETSVSIPTITPAEATHLPHKLVPLQKAEGKICAQAVSAFPPCIPILLPGETVTKEKLEYLDDLKMNQATITGLTKDMITIIS